MNRLPLALFTILFAIALSARGQSISGVQPAALDQPRINAAISIGPLNSGTLLTADFGGGFETFNVQAFFDTGASGILMSSNTADYLNIQRATHLGQNVVFSDVGVAGTEDFNVSQELHISLAPFDSATNDFLDDLETYQTYYTQSFGPVRTQIGPVGIDPDPVLGDLDVFGVPLMRNKVVVMDPKPVNTFIDTMKTHVYNPGHASIPSTSRHVLMTKSNFEPFTVTTPSGGPGPTLDGNPFIGPDPTGASPGTSPAVELSLGTFETSGSFLFDTGAAASMISNDIANQLNVRYREGTEGTEAPVLEFVSDESLVPDQFTLSIGGIGGTKKVVGFFLDSLMLPTVEGISDPNANIDFRGAPVLVTDITLFNPQTQEPLTLDGIFGMNFLVASAFVTEAQPLPIIGDLTPSAFDWITYQHDLSLDPYHAMMGLEINENPPPVGYNLWIGWSGNVWDVNQTTSWGIFQPFTNGSPVEFGDFIYDPNSDTIQVVQEVSPSAMHFSNNLESQGGVHYTLWGSPITGTTGLLKSGNGIVTLQNSNAFTGQTDIQAGTLELQAVQNIGPVLVRSAGFLDMQTSQRFDGLRILDGQARLTAGGDKYLRVSQLEISGTGRLELNDGDIIITNKELTVPEDIRDYLFAGRNNGAWNGPGIKSSAAAGNPNLYAIGYADNALLGRTTFHGETLTSESIVVQFTYAGDATLDGIVDVRDLVKLANSWLGSDTYWFDGDFNYDGLTNAHDLTILARNWQAGVNNPLSSLAFYNQAVALGLPSSLVPEPGMAGMLGLLMLALTRRGRSRLVRI